ncbi:MAG: peptidase T [Gudongella sp.]|nr:peptidase T [Gudongella sp.]
MEKLLNRFINYTKIDTTSDESSISIPSSDAQLELAKKLILELTEIGMEDVTLDEKGYVMASLPSNDAHKNTTVGFIAHMDTSPDMSAKNVDVKKILNYDGKDIILNEKLNIVLSPLNFPDLKENIGKTLLTTDGTTLLGADNKAGIAEIITAMEFLIQNPEILHCNIKVGFTPDEEIGRGADYFDVEKFGADFAYTIDGGPVGELEYENFNAATAKITINGRNVHPGTAKDKMINSILIANEINNMLPVNQRPEYTENYEGFFHLTHLDGMVEKTSMSFIIRDHFKESFETKKELLKKVVSFINLKYGDIVDLKIEDTYYNMKEMILPHMEIIELAKKAMQSIGIEPIVKPIRGGTDGSRLSYMGLLCPNIFTGGFNFHGKFEYIPLEDMELATKTIIEIAKLA